MRKLDFEDKAYLEKLLKQKAERKEKNLPFTEIDHKIEILYRSDDWIQKKIREREEMKPPKPTRLLWQELNRRMSKVMR